MLLLSWWFFVFAFFPSFLSFWFRHAWSLSSRCSVVIRPPPGWHKCRLPSAAPERSSCGSPWSPRGPGRERKGKHSTSLICPCTPCRGAQHRVPGQAGTNRASPSRRTPSATPRANREDSCDEALGDVKVGGGRHTRAKPHYGRTEVVGDVRQHPACFRGDPAAPYQPSCTLPIPACGRQRTGSWSSLRRHLHTFSTGNQQPAGSFIQRLLWSCRCSPESGLLLISARHPCRQN